MATFLRRTCWLSKSIKIPSTIIQRRQLSSNELSTALRPFYFAVHPDLFGQYPKEREVNENSLKRLNAHLDLMQQRRLVHPTKLGFYLRPVNNTTSANLRYVDVTLAGNDIRSAIAQLLRSCNITTEYLDSLKANRPIDFQDDNASLDSILSFFATMSMRRSQQQQRQQHDESAEETMRDRRRFQESLGSWVRKNSASAKKKLDSARPIRREAQALREALRAELQLKDVVWDCGWNISHFRGCLLSLRALSRQHPEPFTNLQGRTVVFGNLTGVGLDGQVILSSGDVRNSWLELIKCVPDQEIFLKRIPAVEKTVSQVLRNIQVDHRKFQPVITAQIYEFQLRTLSASLADYWVKNGYHASWPVSLERFQLVVECEASPLMLSPTGQFIVPAACPAFLVVNFITQNLAEAENRMQQYQSNKILEGEMVALCVSELGLSDIQKDDNVTPDLMAKCCQRLVDAKDEFKPHFNGARLFITHFYSVLQDGEVCIPWNWLD